MGRCVSGHEGRVDLTWSRWRREGAGDDCWLVPLVHLTFPSSIDNSVRELKGGECPLLASVSRLLTCLSEVHFEYRQFFDRSGSNRGARWRRAGENR